ncbi:PREDICTED: acyl-CoA Delta(11) desaturase-like [Dinoponera quadriceps]|uniref:Acyl-CoA Delta(11) desaturase-like n=1 Tax=Dinoponera quadriceps TaxID=609295 RepID=A0A6P3XK66_DINQU|nr:PREDICTED: acyl-CoA Delta(11) desaturase-like [Dinoponera quadriceps]
MELDESVVNGVSTTELGKKNYEWKIVWRNVISFIYIHLAGFYGMYLMFFHVKYLTVLWYIACTVFIKIGVTAGVHRLWSHRSYKAKWPMKLILMILQSAAYQDTIYQWARDHRVHHKYTDTDADPYNASRGLFFSHIGWLLVRKHPKVTEKSAMIDCSDLEQDPFVTFQKKWYVWLMPTFGFILPTLIPYWFWNETFSHAWHVNFARYCTNLNTSWTVNSIAHAWGTKPYDKSIRPTDNIGVAIASLGEGWHNYHHAFPWDYRAAEEFGIYRINVTTIFIQFFALLGLAYNLKAARPEMIKHRVSRNGDTSY